MTPGAKYILDSLPHRPPFRFVSDNLRFDGPDVARADWHVAGNEPVLAGHFPGRPVVPGVIIGEALAQLSGLLVVRRHAGHDDSVSPAAGKLAHLDMRFPTTVEPPATVELSSTLIRVFGSLWQFEGLAVCAGETVGRGTLALAIATPTPPLPKEQT